MSTKLLHTVSLSLLLASPAVSVAASNTVPAKAASPLNPNFVNIPGKEITLPYDSCPDTDILGIRLGQNISTLASQYPLQFVTPNGSMFGGVTISAPEGYGMMWFPDRQKDAETSSSIQYPGSGAQVTVYSDKFDALRHQAINKINDFEFSDEDYDQIKVTTKSSGRHFTTARF